MGSGITFSGFNNIDFNLILNAIMQQESRPLVALQSQQSAMQSRANTYTTLVTKTQALQTAAAALADSTNFAGFSATSTDSTAVAISTGSSATAGRYEVVVTELAKAQVTASSSSAPDSDTTIVADSGTLTIGGESITLTAGVTLEELAEAINANADVPASASVVQASAGNYRLVLTGKNTGEANAFTVTNTLSGGTGVTFTDTDNDGTTGDDLADNAVNAIDAELTVNNIAITSASNTLEDVVPGSTITLFKKDSATTVVLEISEDTSSIKTRLESFVAAYNDLVKFAGDQTKSANNKETASIGRDPLMRQLRATLRSALTVEYASGGTFKSLAQIGVQLTQSGTLELNETVFNDALAEGADEVSALLAGTTVNPGALASIKTTLKEYTQTAGFLLEAREQLTEAAARLTKQITAMEDRLALRRAALQQEFIAADIAMSQLKSQSASIASFGGIF